jgi:hypothetical protein
VQEFTACETDYVYSNFKIISKHIVIVMRLERVNMLPNSVTAT